MQFESADIPKTDIDYIIRLDCKNRSIEVISLQEMKGPGGLYGWLTSEVSPSSWSWVWWIRWWWWWRPQALGVGLLYHSIINVNDHTKKNMPCYCYLGSGVAWHIKLQFKSWVGEEGRTREGNRRRSRKRGVGAAPWQQQTCTINTCIYIYIYIYIYNFYIYKCKPAEHAHYNII